MYVIIVRKRYDRRFVSQYAITFPVAVPNEVFSNFDYSPKCYISHHSGFQDTLANRSQPLPKNVQ